MGTFASSSISRNSDPSRKKPYNIHSQGPRETKLTFNTFFFVLVFFLPPLGKIKNHREKKSSRRRLLKYKTKKFIKLRKLPPPPPAGLGKSWVWGKGSCVRRRKVTGKTSTGSHPHPSLHDRKNLCVCVCVQGLRVRLGTVFLGEWGVINTGPLEERGGCQRRKLRKIPQIHNRVCILLLAPHMGIPHPLSPRFSSPQNSKTHFHPHPFHPTPVLPVFIFHLFYFLGFQNTPAFTKVPPARGDPATPPSFIFLSIPF